MGDIKMKKFISIFIAVIMSLTMFSSVTSLADNSVQAPQSNLEISGGGASHVCTWSVITDYDTAKIAFKDNKKILDKCSTELFLNYNIYVISFSVNGAAKVTYVEPFKYNVYYPKMLCKCLTTYTDYLIVNKNTDFNGIISLNNTYASNGKSETQWLYPQKVYFYIPNQGSDIVSNQIQIPIIKKVTKLKSKSPKKKAIKASWKKVKDASGYIVKISSNKKFKSEKTKRYAVKKNSITIKKLKRKKKYYVKVKAYKNIILNGKRVNVYSKEWSKIKSVKTK